MIVEAIGRALFNTIETCVQLVELVRSEAFGDHDNKDSSTTTSTSSYNYKYNSLWSWNSSLLSLWLAVLLTLIGIALLMKLASSVRRVSRVFKQVLTYQYQLPCS